jgi:hypothetical protein
MERRLKKREELKMQLPSWWTAEEITPTSEEHAAVDWDYDLDYAEHATQHAAEHATQQSTPLSKVSLSTPLSKVSLSTPLSKVSLSTRTSTSTSTQAHRNINSSRHWGSKYSISRNHKHTGTPSTGDR